MIDMAEYLSKLLHKRIKVKETTWEQYRQVSREQNVPDWQTDGTIEWLKYDPNIWITGEDQDTIQKITGDNPVTMEYFVAQHAAKFGWSQPRISGGKKDTIDDPIMQSRLVHAN
jgi:hypothetical protein